MNTMEINLQTGTKIENPSEIEALNQTADVDKDTSKAVKEEKRPDLTKPIEVTDHMEVVVNGKKCLLKVNPDTGQLCAYPLIPTGKYSQTCVSSHFDLVPSFPITATSLDSKMTIYIINLTLLVSHFH